MGFKLEVMKKKMKNHTLLLVFGSNTSYYKRKTSKFMFLYFSFVFSFLFCCLLVGPQLISVYTFAIGNDGLVDTVGYVPICSSIASGTMCCDRSNIRSDICYMKGDIRTQSATSSIILYSSNNGGFGIEGDDEEEEEIQHEKIKPYTRKWEKSVMDTIDELHLVVKKSTFGNADDCQVKHPVPAVVFSNGGYTGNIYHEFNDGIIPLYITSQQLNKEVVFVMLEYHDWWITKYESILSHLTNYPVVDYSGDNRTHCFPKAIVGLRIHDELTIDSSQMQDSTSIRDFQMLLDRSYLPRIEDLIQEEQQEAQLKSDLKLEGRQSNKPKLVIISRNGSRSIINENSMVEMAKQIGFEVEVLRPDQTTELAKIYRALNSSDVMIGVHGAAMTHFLFMRPGSVFIQVIPLGTDWAAQTYYGDPAMKLGLKYINYNILPRESSLYGSYSKDDPVLKDPESINAMGWEFTKKIYLDGQNVNLELGRFRKSLVRAYDYILQRNRRQKHPRRRHLRVQLELDTASKACTRRVTTALAKVAPSICDLEFESILSHLTNYPVVDYSGDNRTHCFPEAIVGLRIHDELTIDSSQMQDSTSIKDFHMLLDRSYWPRIEGLIQEEQQEAQLKSAVKLKEKRSKKPKLVIVSRNGSRAINNEDAMVEMAKQIGFEVEVLKPDRTTELAKIYRALNSSDVMIGVHGAAMTHFLFMRPGSVFIQVIPLGTDWAAQTYFGDPAMKLGLKYINYNILPRESSLYGSYSKDDPVLKDPESINAMGWEFTKKIYLDGQNVNLELGRFRKSLVRAYDYILQRNRRQRPPRRRHLR